MFATSDSRSLTGRNNLCGLLLQINIAHIKKDIPIDDELRINFICILHETLEWNCLENSLSHRHRKLYKIVWNCFLWQCMRIVTSKLCVWIERRDALKAQTNAFYYEFSLHIQTWHTHTCPTMCVYVYGLWSITENLHISSKVCVCICIVRYILWCALHTQLIGCLGWV